MASSLAPVGVGDLGIGNQWRNTVVEACAQLLGKSLDTLRHDYSATLNVKNAAFTNQSRRNAPRDFSDYVIMTTLESKEKNININVDREHASAWLFNLMDRTGNGYVCREEFERYTPYMSPASDEAVCTDIFACLISLQKEKENETDATVENENERLNSIASSRYRDADDDIDNDNGDDKSDNDDDANDSNNRRKGREKKLSKEVSKILVSPDERARKTSFEDDDGGMATNITNTTANLFPISLALRYQTWRSYYEKVLDQYHKRHPEWNKVKAICGIDSTEVLIYFEQAMVHAEILPKWGTLFLSQRYIIFYESGTRNHYVARLGAIIDVCKASIPYLMRDVFELYLMSHSQSAALGITSVQRDHSIEHNNNNNNNTGTNNNNSNNNNNDEDRLIPQHVEKNMQKFTNGDKPLIFSFSEFMDTSKRDKWVLILKEVIAAHKLHFSMQFGEAGRTSPLLRMGTIPEDGQHNISPNISPAGRVALETPADTNDNITYYSPFRNEPSPPLLVIAAHANISRYLAVKDIMNRKKKQQQRNNNNDTNGNGNGNLPEEICLLFSNNNIHAAKIRWYVDSVRKHNRWNDKSFIERLVNSIRSNIEANIRVYSANDDRPFDLQILATGIGRFAELCTPVVRVVQYCNNLFQWENPPASILAILICLFIARQGLISYIPGIAVFAQLLFVVEIRMNYLGIFKDIGRETADEVQEQQRNFFQMLGQVQNGLQAAQNVITRANVQLGKFQTLFLWRTYAWRTWAVIGIMAGIMLTLFIVPVRILFMVLTFFLFGKHFLPPSNPVLKFWDSIPSHVELTSD